MIPFTWSAIACAACLAVGALVGSTWTSRAYDTREAKAAAVADQAVVVAVAKAVAIKDAQIAAEFIPREIYEKQLQAVRVPVETIRTRLVRSACVVRQLTAETIDTSDRLPVPVGNPERPVYETVAIDYNDALIGNVAAEVPACVLNTDQLDGLQATVLANSAKPE